ncbi:hypothetical protein D4764_06G0000270 [Takifugu flavidus]|uniref:Uncharacterized protein n=1 Tax=Takifugu flavidus TaxID=433684 RepID=A0A5C6MYG3_9TELE|nr:hypothetical protein D4764_06G0000270 [Takifugu flavidus]
MGKEGVKKSAFRCTLRHGGSTRCQGNLRQLIRERDGGRAARQQRGDEIKMSDAFGSRAPGPEPSERCQLCPENSIRRARWRRRPWRRREDVHTVAVVKPGMMVTLTMAAFMS